MGDTMIEDFIKIATGISCLFAVAQHAVYAAGNNEDAAAAAATLPYAAVAMGALIISTYIWFA
jgi:hypothetical protein